MKKILYRKGASIVRGTIGLSFLAPLLFSVSCINENNGSCTESLAADEKADNVAVLFADSAPGISSAEAFNYDMNKMANTLSSPPYNFKVIKQPQATRDDIINRTAEAAASLKENGTLLFFYTGHGDVGYLEETSSQDIAWATSQGKYARLVMILEACYSGSFTKGATAIQRDSKAYNGLLIMTAAKDDESSADDGVESYFPKYLSAGLQQFSTKASVTLNDLITWVHTSAASENPEQTGDLKADPVSILNEPLVESSKPTANPTVTPGPTSTPTPTSSSDLSTAVGSGSQEPSGYTDWTKKPATKSTTRRSTCK